MAQKFNFSGDSKQPSDSTSSKPAPPTTTPRPASATPLPPSADQPRKTEKAKQRAKKSGFVPSSAPSLPSMGPRTPPQPLSHRLVSSKEWEELVSIVSLDNYEKLEKRIAQQPDIPVIFSPVRKTTLLHIAAKARASRCAAVLIDNGAIPDLPNSTGKTPAQVAAEAGASALVNFINSQPPHSIPLPTTTRVPAVQQQINPHQAITLGKAEDITDYLSQGGDPNAVAKKGSSYLIHTAVFKRNLPVIKLLVEHGANLEYRNANGLTALEFAASKDPKGKDYEIVKYLIQEEEKRGLNSWRRPSPASTPVPSPSPPPSAPSVPPPVPAPAPYDPCILPLMCVTQIDAGQPVSEIYPYLEAGGAPCTLLHEGRTLLEVAVQRRQERGFWELYNLGWPVTEEMMQDEWVKTLFSGNNISSNEIMMREMLARQRRTIIMLSRKLAEMDKPQLDGPLYLNFEEF